MKYQTKTYDFTRISMRVNTKLGFRKGKFRGQEYYLIKPENSFR